MNPSSGRSVDLDDPAFETLDAARLGIAAQVLRVQPCIEVIGIGDVRQRRVRRHIGGRSHELSARRGNRIQRVGADALRFAGTEHFEPVLMEGQHAVVMANAAKAVDVAVADAAPVDEFDAELERALRLLDELDLIDFEDLIEQLQVRNRRLADAHRTDRFRFDQSNRDLWALILLRGRRRPSSRPCRPR